MTRKRGAPVLIELITRPSGPSVGGAGTTPAHSEGAVRGGNAVSNPDNWTSTPRSKGGSGDKSDLRLPALLIGAGIIVVVIASIVGFQLGQKKERQDWANGNAVGPGSGSGSPNSAPVPAPVAPVNDPLNTDPNAAAGGGVIKPPAPMPTPPVAEAGLQDGWNYLVVASLRRADAEVAARYLADSGIPVQLVAAERGGVDRGGSGANNALWQLWVLRGVPSGEYSQRRSEREALETKVKLLGRTWKAQNRKAPTDFASTYWVRYKA